MCQHTILKIKNYHSWTPYLFWQQLVQFCPRGYLLEGKIFELRMSGIAQVQILKASEGQMRSRSCQSGFITLIINQNGLSGIQGPLGPDPFSSPKLGSGISMDLVRMQAQFREISKFLFSSLKFLAFTLVMIFASKMTIQA